MMCSQWDHETLTERPWHMEDSRATFGQAQARHDAGLAAGVSASGATRRRRGALYSLRRSAPISAISRCNVS
jgi:hypothetical protein